MMSLTADFRECKADLASEKFVKHLVNGIIDKLGMKKISEIVSVDYETGDIEHGISAFCLIAESHVSVHTYPDKSLVFVDIFSCREIDVDDIHSYLKNELKGEAEINTFSRDFSDIELETVRGFDPKKPLEIEDFRRIGFQATNVARAAEIIKRMKKDECTIFLSFTSNMVSSGLRELFAYLVKEKMVDAIITTVGSVEEDLMKSIKPFFIGDFEVSDKDLHRKGVNRVGNIFIPNDRYEALEKHLVPFFEKMQDIPRSPSEIIFELGKTISDENSILYWATKNNIPIFCPAITDGAFGLQLYFFNASGGHISIDVTKDMPALAELVYNAKKTGGIILGGGVAKHHTIGINIVRGGLDYAVYVSTGTEYDGSLSGARPKEAKSWGKIKENANSVFVEGDATIIFPLILSMIL